MSEIDELRGRMARQAACFAESNGYTPSPVPLVK
ncbi:MAG: AraC family transcriptional regulator, partial [Serratia liquefaciens]|nr:AraC family transcriptional regulator [Serratia liquefaciens]